MIRRDREHGRAAVRLTVDFLSARSFLFFIIRSHPSCLVVTDVDQVSE